MFFLVSWNHFSCASFVLIPGTLLIVIFKYFLQIRAWGTQPDEDDKDKIEAYESIFEILVVLSSLFMLSIWYECKDRMYQ